jgi:hypothetical protein
MPEILRKSRSTREVTILAGLVRPHNYRGHSAATGDVMQWAKESRDLAETAAYDGLSLII